MPALAVFYPRRREYTSSGLGRYKPASQNQFSPSSKVVYSRINNLQVFNCILYSFNLYKTGTTASFINCATPSPDLLGNYALGLNNASVLVKNSIIPGAGTTSNINTVYENNLFAEAQPAQLPAGSNNKWAQTPADRW